MNLTQAAGIIFYAIPMIALFDYIVFRKWARCNHCGALPEWWSWIPACLVECLFFITGLYFGGVLK